MTFAGIGVAFAQTVTYTTKFEGDVAAVSADPSIAAADPATQWSQHAPGSGAKAAIVTITPVRGGTTTVTISDKKGGTTVIHVIVNGTHAFIVANAAMNRLDEFAAGAGGAATPSRVLQSGLTVRGMVYDAAGNLYVSSGASIEVYAPGATSPFRFIRGSQTGLNCAQSIALDGAGEIFVMNCGLVTVYGPSQDGNAAPVRTIQVPDAGPGLTIASDAAGDIYVFHPGGTAHIDFYVPGASGAATPASVITSTDLNGFPWGGALGLDGAGNLYAVVHPNGPIPARIEMFGHGAAGPSTPLRSIDLAVYSQDMAIDAAGSVWTTWFDGNLEHVSGFAADANGNASPLAQFVAAGLRDTGHIALDPAGIPHVSDYFLNVIDGFSPASTGTALPTSSLSTGPVGVGQPNGIALDTHGALYVANQQGQIVVFSSMQDGSPSPVRTIGMYPIDLPYGSSVAVDAQGYVYAPKGDSIGVYAPGANGDAVPVRTLGGPDTGISGPRQIVFDRNGDLVVANLGNSSIQVFAPGASGDAAPIATIAGSNTGIAPLAVAIDSTGAIYVGNAWNGAASVSVFAAGASGNVAPTRVLVGSQVPGGGTNALTLDSSDYLYALIGDGVAIWQAGASGNVAPYQVVQRSATEGGFWDSIVTEP